VTILEARRKLGLSQGRLARMIGCAQSALSRWECGDAAPSPAYAAALEELGVEIDRAGDPDARERENEALLVEWETTGDTQRVLAKRHGVHVNTISNRLNRAEAVRRRERIRKGLRG
jgi:ribosome-binding protein aMBF1 (putative translation factor)